MTNQQPSLDAVELVLHLPDLIANLASLSFRVVTPVGGGVEERLKRRGLPSLENALTAPRERWDELLDEVVEQGTPATERSVPVEDLKKQVGEMLSAAEPRGDLLTLCSACALVGRDEASHLPMMDFKAPVSKDNSEFLLYMLQREGFQGFLLESGRSYHFLGTAPCSREAWVRIMGRFLLLPGSDVRYIGHRLLDGVGLLRINASGTRPRPFVVAVVQPT